MFYIFNDINSTKRDVVLFLRLEETWNLPLSNKIHFVLIRRVVSEISSFKVALNFEFFGIAVLVERSNPFVRIDLPQA